MTQKTNITLRKDTRKRIKLWYARAIIKYTKYTIHNDKYMMENTESKTMKRYWAWCIESDQKILDKFEKIIQSEAGA